RLARSDWSGRLGDIGRSADDLDARGHDLQRPIALCIPVEALMLFFVARGVRSFTWPSLSETRIRVSERRVHVLCRLSDRQIGIQSLIAQVERATHFDPLRLNPLIEHFGSRRRGELLKDSRQRRQGRFAIRLIDSLYA